MTSHLSSNSPNFFDLIDRDAIVERLATGFAFTEGPVWHPLDGYLLFNDIPNNTMWRWHPDTGLTPSRQPNNKGNGMTYDRQGRLLLCEHATSSVVRIESDGSTTALASTYDGKQLNSPNDLIVHSNGAIYFTDPTYGRVPVFGIERDVELEFRGVYRIQPDGDLELLIDDFAQPNGLCVSPDETRLYVNDTEEAHIREFDLAPDGSILEERLLRGEIRSDNPDDGVPDGMKCDQEGNIYVTGPGGIWVLNPNGEHLGIIHLPERAANLHWGESDWRTLFITASESIYRMITRVAGRLEPYMKDK